LAAEPDEIERTALDHYPVPNPFTYISATSAMDYLSYLNDAYLFFLVPRFDYSLKVQSVNPRKVFCVDTGLVHFNSLSASSDLGRLLENYIFLELKKKFREVYYYKKLWNVTSLRITFI
jgi:predicted AAA+ superfamily ATPase